MTDLVFTMTGRKLGKVHGAGIALYEAAVTAREKLDPLARDYIEARSRECTAALRFSESSWLYVGPVAGGDWSPEMSEYRDALLRLKAHCVANTKRLPIDHSAGKKGLPLFDLIQKRGD